MRIAALTLSVLTAASTTLRAQSPLPKDSLERGRQYALWFHTSAADSLASRMSAELLADIGGRDGVLEGMTQITMRAGTFDKVLQEQWVWRGGARQFWQTAQMTGMQEPIVVRFVMDTSGMITGLGINPQSRTPPADSLGPIIKP